MITNYYNDKTEKLSFKEFIDKILQDGQEIQNVIVVAKETIVVEKEATASSKKQTLKTEFVNEAIILTFKPF